MNMYYINLTPEEIFTDDLGIDAVIIVSAASIQEAKEKILITLQSEGYQADLNELDPIEYNGESLFIPTR